VDVDDFLTQKRLPSFLAAAKKKVAVSRTDVNSW
jgi:hypothetical protein